MTEKEIERQNFILWYSLYATEKELETARINNREALDRVLKEYAKEVDEIDKTKHLCESIIQSKSIQTQSFDALLKINCSSPEEKK